MEIKELFKRIIPEQNKKLVAGYNNFEKLVTELKKRELPASIVVKLNRDIDSINSFAGPDKALGKKLRKSQTEILLLLEKELKLVPINHYRNRWLALGLAVFGIPFGVAMGVSLGSMAFMGVGLPLGMAVGIAIGTDMDKKAKANGQQLDLEIK